MQRIQQKLKLKPNQYKKISRPIKSSTPTPDYRD
jgi:hypothetical protein